MDVGSQGPRVYLSYSSQSGAAQEVQLLVAWLRREGVECLPDELDEPPGENLAAWLGARSAATHVLAVASSQDPPDYWAGWPGDVDRPALAFLLFAPEGAGAVPPTLRTVVPVFAVGAEGGDERLLHYLEGKAEAAIRGPSAHIASDLWTDRDTMGYRYYAYALYHFLTHARTRRGPLTISVQAPWGGGKTSLMRMVQQQLDPPGARLTGAEREAAGVCRGRGGGGREGSGLTVQDLLEGGRPPMPGLLPDAAGDGHRITVWFNAWKYQSTEQVWAGLADCIVRAITDRLSPADRERFWLHLQWARIDTDKVRRTFWNHVFSTFLGYFLGVPWPHVAAVVCGAALAWVNASRGADPWWGLGGTALAEVIQAGVRLTRIIRDVKKRDLKVDFADYVSAPDYSAHAGFIHHVADDLSKVLVLVPEAQKPVVVFVDDLDRCSPGKVAEVMEAINLFLAGDFREFQFVIAMDTEMVAAALDVAHKEIVARLPDGGGESPLGWRFMDKFVQLPFQLPPPDPRDREAYVQSLFEDDAADAVATGQPAPAPAGVAGAWSDGLRLGERAAIQREAERFTDRDRAVQRRIVADALKFSDNPRELKRFVNLLRFSWYLRAARLARDLPAPTDGQLARWSTLLLRWPQVARWVHQGEGALRLRLLEETGEALRHRCDVAAVVAAVLAITPDGHPWALDPALWSFFGDPSAESLAAAAGLGLW
jgi:hypothetical protein